MDSGAYRGGINLVRTMRRWMDGLGPAHLPSPNDPFVGDVCPADVSVVYIYTTAGCCCCQGKKKKRKTNVGEEYKSLRFLAAALQKTHAPPRTETKTNSREKLFEGEKRRRRRNPLRVYRRVVCRSRSRPSVYTQEEELLSLSPYSSKLYGPVHFQQQEE